MRKDATGRAIYCRRGPTVCMRLPARQDLLTEYFSVVIKQSKRLLAKRDGQKCRQRESYFFFLIRKRNSRIWRSISLSFCSR